jgi:hypothetical protein
MLIEGKDIYTTFSYPVQPPIAYPNAALTVDMEK